jgi:hypothetical protein
VNFEVYVCFTSHRSFQICELADEKMLQDVDLLFE